MANIPNYYQRQQQPQMKPPPVPEKKRRFRWILIWLPAVIGLLYWIGSSISPSGSWEELMDVLGIRNRERYGQLAILGVLICCVCGIARVLRRNKKE